MERDDASDGQVDCDVSLVLVVAMLMMIVVVSLREIGGIFGTNKANIVLVDTGLIKHSSGA